MQSRHRHGPQWILWNRTSSIATTSKHTADTRFACVQSGMRIFATNSGPAGHRILQYQEHSQPVRCQQQLLLPRLYWRDISRQGISSIISKPRLTCATHLYIKQWNDSIRHSAYMGRGIGKITIHLLVELLCRDSSATRTILLFIAPDATDAPL